MKHIGLKIAAALLVLGAGACSSDRFGAVPAKDPAERALGTTQLSATAYQLTVGDRVRVTVFDIATEAHEYTIDETGAVAIPALDPLTIKGKTTKDGVYTEAQSERGAATAKTTCAACHGRTMKGGMLGPSLVGDMFKGNYDGAPLADLFDKIKMTMPQNNPGTLTPEATADVVAFILKLNEFPAGEGEVPNDADALKTITFKQ